MAQTYRPYASRAMWHLPIAVIGIYNYYESRNQDRS